MRESDKRLWAFRSTFVYISLRYEIGIDSWLVDGLVPKARKHLKKMGLMVLVTDEELQLQFVSMRKAGVFKECTVLGGPKAKRGSRGGAV
jgi:hypothetical protein